MKGSFIKGMSLLAIVFVFSSPLAFAKHSKKNEVYKDADMNVCPSQQPHWYVAGNIGLSHLYDDPNPGSGNSVDQNGPGWDVDLGYQFTRMFGGEVGYTQYYNSRETSGSTVIAKTSHFAVHANATGKYPLVDKISALGKLGLAYSYAQKVAVGAGTAKSSGAVSLYYGLGFVYELTSRVDMIAQWAEVRGNKYTGSSDLWSLGLAFAIV